MEWKAGDWAIFTGAISPACAPAHGRAGREGGTLVEIIDVGNPDPDDTSLSGHTIFARSSSSGSAGAVHPDELEVPPWLSGDGGGLLTEAPITTTAGRQLRLDKEQMTVDRAKEQMGRTGFLIE